MRDKLASEILHSKDGRRLSLLKVDACEMADLVHWGKMTREQLFKHLAELPSVSDINSMVRSVNSMDIEQVRRELAEYDAKNKR